MWAHDQNGRQCAKWIPFSWFTSFISFYYFSCTQKGTWYQISFATFIEVKCLVNTALGNLDSLAGIELEIYISYQYLLSIELWMLCQSNFSLKKTHIRVGQPNPSNLIEFELLFGLGSQHARQWLATQVGEDVEHLGRLLGQHADAHGDAIDVVVRDGLESRKYVN